MGYSIGELVNLEEIAKQIHKPSKPPHKNVSKKRLKKKARVQKEKERLAKKKALAQTQEAKKKAYDEKRRAEEERVRAYREKVEKESTFIKKEVVTDEEPKPKPIIKTKSKRPKKEGRKKKKLIKKLSAKKKVPEQPTKVLTPNDDIQNPYRNSISRYNQKIKELKDVCWLPKLEQTKENKAFHDAEIVYFNREKMSEVELKNLDLIIKTVIDTPIEDFENLIKPPKKTHNQQGQKYEHPISFISVSEVVENLYIKLREAYITEHMQRVNDILKVVLTTQGFYAYGERTLLEEDIKTKREILADFKNEEVKPLSSVQTRFSQHYKTKLLQAYTICLNVNYDLNSYRNFLADIIGNVDSSYVPKIKALSDKAIIQLYYGELDKSWVNLYYQESVDDNHIITIFDRLYDILREEELV